MADELMPLSGGRRAHFGGWAATLVDSLDTLWILGMKNEFWEAVEAVMTIDFSTPADDDATTISLFETTIRYLGGLLAAYDLSGDVRLMYKATELGDTLYGAFDTPNRMPVTHWNMLLAASGHKQIADSKAILAEVSSLTLEFTRLSQLTGNQKYYDAVCRITNVLARQQRLTAVPGMVPFTVRPKRLDFHSGSEYSVGAMADSFYEYLVKMGALLHGSRKYENMYTMAVDAIIDHALFRPMVPNEEDILMAGKVRAFTKLDAVVRPDVEHMGCFAGGMLALGGRLLGNATHLEIGRRLTDGCIWAYEHTQLGIMPEDFTMVACANRSSCSWNETLWRQAVKERSLTIPGLFTGPTNHNAVTDELRLPMGVTSISNKRYVLRPEAIESVFVLYRITGDSALQDSAWRMFQSIQNATQTQFANAALADVTDPAAPKMDEMESFWLGETLKYFYLIFSEPGLISLDEYVLNTEAHPFRIPQRGFWGWT
ncbi:hypothetical protein LTR08_002498 [Meristemomyces frigidus]|nr:hypothetical protein LTR08_002498 [Meristemomyces frigidus]